MAKCPKCGKEIEYLKATVTEVSDYSFYGEGDWNFEEGYSFDYEGLRCPECDEVIMDGEESATAFLKGEEYAEASNSD